MKHIQLIVASIFACLQVYAFPDYTGYSGAPGSQGICAGSCHGSSGGTIVVAGFPSSYSPGQSYTITVEHNGGSSIANFNASVRIGTGTQIAGVLAAGQNTQVYSASGEAEGVHFATASHSSGTFNWTAPSPAVGPVKLYLSGHQGTSASGPNTEIQLTAQGAAVEEGSGSRRPVPTFRVEPTIVTSKLVLCVDNLLQQGTIRILNHAGRLVARLPVAAGRGLSIVWHPADSHGHRLASGLYYASLCTPGRREVRKFSLR